MFGKYDDTPAAISLGIYLIGGLFYTVQLLFMTEAWLEGNGIGPEAVGVARVLGFTWLGLTISLLRTYVTGPDGQNAYFIALLIAQIGICLLYTSPSPRDRG